MSKNFQSDNVTPACDAIMAAVNAANVGSATSYGGDDITRSLQKVASEVFGTEVAIFPVTTGTAANSLALSQLVPPYGAVYCHEAAHIVTDECGAPELLRAAPNYSDCRPPTARSGPSSWRSAIAFADEMGVHHVKPGAVSLTQATEWGTVYTLSEIAALSAMARRHGLPVHMDGARFANAWCTWAARPPRRPGNAVSMCSRSAPPRTARCVPKPWCFSTLPAGMISNAVANAEGICGPRCDS